MKSILPICLLLLISAWHSWAGALERDFEQRRDEIRARARALLLSREMAFMEREDLVIRDEQLISSALDRVMRNMESWIDSDESRMAFFLKSEVMTARDEMIKSDGGIAALNRLAKDAFANPRIEQKVEERPGRSPDWLEKQVARLASKIFPGQPITAKGVAAARWVEVHADYGLVPVPLERNMLHKNSSSLLRYRRDATGEWLDQIHPHRPRTDLVIQRAKDLMRDYPAATRFVLRMMVLRTSGAPVTWEYTVEPTPYGDLAISGTGAAPGFHDRFHSRQPKL